MEDMMRSNVRDRSAGATRRTVVGLVAAWLLAAVALLSWPGGATPARATTTDSASVTVTGELGDATASADGQSTVHLEGSGFQVVEGGFGGVYVLFGWIAGDGWEPSQGGQSGTDYLYIPDSQAADNNGYMRFVTFPGSSTAGEANGGELSADGSWSADLNIPGPVVELTDAAGNGREVDCRVETCGIITIGAHGVVNANNETFTPVSFVEGAATEPEAPTDGAGEDGQDGDTTDADTDDESVTDGATPDDSAVGDAPSDGPSAGSGEATSADAAGAAETDSGDEEEAESGGLAWPWIAGGAVVVAGLVGGGVVIARRN
jgi:hypothetical protein